jgi:hypothetical protein
MKSAIALQSEVLMTAVASVALARATSNGELKRAIAGADASSTSMAIVPKMILIIFERPN